MFTEPLSFSVSMMGTSQSISTVSPHETSLRSLLPVSPVVQTGIVEGERG